MPAGSDEPVRTGVRRQLSDPEAAVRRAALRAERVAAGLDELDRWLKDRIRSGLSGLEHAGYAEIDRVAARMVDAQAPGVANLLRAIPAELAGAGWPARVLEQFAALHLLIQAHRRLTELPPGLQATVRSRVGYPVSKQDVLARPGIADRWLAVGMVDVVEFRLETRRVWLQGQTTGRWALWLSFAPPGGYLDTTVLPGQLLDAELHFYPGSGQQRALIGRPVDLGEASRPTNGAGHRDPGRCPAPVRTAAGRGSLGDPDARPARGHADSRSFRRTMAASRSSRNSLQAGRADRRTLVAAGAIRRRTHRPLRRVGRQSVATARRSAR